MPYSKQQTIYYRGIQRELREKLTLRSIGKRVKTHAESEGLALSKSAGDVLLDQEARINNFDSDLIRNIRSEKESREVERDRGSRAHRVAKVRRELVDEVGSVLLSELDARIVNVAQSSL